MNEQEYARLADDVRAAIEMYNREPGAFDNDMLEQLTGVANELGIPFKPRFSMGRAARAAAFELADTALLGALPEEWKPHAFGDENFGRSLGGMLGFAVPVAAGLKVGRGAAAALGTFGRNYGMGMGQRAGLGAVHRAMAGSKAGIGLQEKLAALRKLAQGTKNKTLRDFYKFSLRKAYGAIPVAERIGRGMAKYGGRPLAIAAQYPRAVKYGVAAPVTVGSYNIFEPGPMDYYGNPENYLEIPEEDLP